MGLSQHPFITNHCAKIGAPGPSKNEKIHLSRPVQHAMAHSLSTFDCVNLCEILVELSY